jgi:proteasome lid subunit RPN8/RPN11
LLISDKSKRVTESIRMKNAFDGPKNDRYNIDPLELFKADRASAQKGLTIAGIYHSHPDYPASLSKFDTEHSFSWYSYIVISVPQGKAGETKAWIPKEDRTAASEEVVEVLE